jgi:hypothetical protein
VEAEAEEATTSPNLPLYLQVPSFPCPTVTGGGCSIASP